MKTYTYFFLSICKKQLLHLPFFYPLPQTYKNNTFFSPVLPIRQEGIIIFIL